MAVSDSMFLFEVVLENVKSMVESKQLVVRADFADVFSLDLKDPKFLNVVIPQPPPPPPEPPGKKGKKGKKEPKKGKKGKGKAEEPPPPQEPVIQSGQSVLFASSPDILLELMKKEPINVSLWNKEDGMTIVGSTNVPWDFRYMDYLESITLKCHKPRPLTVKGEYNIFNEDTAKLMATVTLQIKLSHLEDKITSMFRQVPCPTPGVTKFLYTGIYSKQTSYMCSMKTDTAIDGNKNEKGDEDEKEMDQHVETTFVKAQPMRYADYTNAAATNTTFLSDEDYCCLKKEDRPPESIYHRPPVVPDLGFLADYVTKVIRSCNENMRMLTPHPNIRPLHRATDIDRVCGCNRDWPEGELADRMQTEAHRLNCAPCNDTQSKADPNPHTFNIHNIRGPCGKVECKLAKRMREYIHNLAVEDNKEIDLSEIVGPCGHRECTIAEEIQKIIRKEGVYSSGCTQDGTHTVCACENKLKESLTHPEVKKCDSGCSHDCTSTTSEGKCESPECPANENSAIGKQVYFVGYCSVDEGHSGATKKEEDVINFTEIPCKAALNCSKSCIPVDTQDDDIEINLGEIGPCCNNQTCDVADQVTKYLTEAKLEGKEDDETCYCDCKCLLKVGKETTYCSVCGGYQVAGSDLHDKAPYGMPPLPCPIYHRLLDRSRSSKIGREWSSTSARRRLDDSASKRSKASKTSNETTITKSPRAVSSERSDKDKKTSTKSSKSSSQIGPEKKKVGKFTFNRGFEGIPAHIGHSKCCLPYGYNDVPQTPNVPKRMGWLWTSLDVPGMKFRPDWRPGAVPKALAARYRIGRGGDDTTVAKKKRLKALMKRKPRKDIKKPALIIKKTDGEFNVHMEVMKVYSTERLPHQYPYEIDKEPVLFDVVRTPEVNEKRRRRKERQERREQREKKRFLQSTFRNLCEEICLKSYKEHIGLLPKSNPNNPECPCYPEEPDLIALPHSCVCSDTSGTESDTETDGDDWVVEFTPPYAKFDPTAKRPPHTNEQETQYTYLDYKVKLIGKDGQPVPRFFKGPDGKEVCSDLGGFRGPDGGWLMIGKDGFIAKDNRWVPSTFIGPDGEVYSSEDPSFKDANGIEYEIGVDGYVDKSGHWVTHPGRGKPPSPKPKSRPASRAPSATSTLTCVPNVTISEFILMNILPHGRDINLLKKRFLELQSEGRTDLVYPMGKRIPIPESPRKKKDGKGRRSPSNKSKKSKSPARGKPDVKAGKVEPSPTPAAQKQKPGKKNVVIKFQQGGADGGAGAGRGPGAGAGAARGPPAGAGAGRGPAAGAGAGRGPSAGAGAARGPGAAAGAPRGASPGARAASGPGQRGGTATRRLSPDAKRSRTQKVSIKTPPKPVPLEELSPRERALRILRNPRLMKGRRVCKLAKLLGDNHSISGYHKECYGTNIGECCAEKGGICGQVFKEVHGGREATRAK